MHESEVQGEGIFLWLLFSTGNCFLVLIKSWKEMQPLLYRFESLSFKVRAVLYRSWGGPV